MKESDECFFIDTNVLVYAFDSSDKKKHQLAKNKIMPILLKQKKAMISTQTLGEFFSIVTKKIQNPLIMSEAHEIICKLSELESLRVVSISPATVIAAIEITDRAKTSYWDALIAATMKENNIREILTENVKDFQNITGLIVTNPFSENA